MSRLALFGGKKIRNKPFPYPPYSVLGKSEKKAVLQSLEYGYLSRFASSPSPFFLGAGFAKKFEERVSRYYGVKYAVSTSCCTAALHIALAAAGIGLGDEVIVTPWSFSSSAKAPLYVHAVPIFADVEDKTYGLDPQSIEQHITKYTKALIVVHLFGHPARMNEIMQIAVKHKLTVIEDCAQAHGAMYRGKRVGTIGDMGVFSFGASKQISSGEGGVLITNNALLADRAQMLRNHGEVLGPVKTKEEMEGILGYGYLMDEMSAALAYIQMGRLDRQLLIRSRNAGQMNAMLKKFDFLAIPQIEKNCSHSYYMYPLRYNETKAGIPVQLFTKALHAEGIPVGSGYYEPLYLNPVYRWKEFYGKGHFPYSLHPRKVEYQRGDCPVVERLQQHEMISTMWAHPRLKKRDRQDVFRAVGKISENFDLLRKSQ